MRPSVEASPFSQFETGRARRVILMFVALAGIAVSAGCFGYARTAFVHSVDDCEGYVWPNQRPACRECVTRPRPRDGKTWSWFPNYNPPMCGAGQIVPY